MSPHHSRPLIACLTLLAASCYVCLSAGSQVAGLRRITNTPEQALNLNPTLSGDGRRVAFESTAGLVGAGSGAGFQAVSANLTGEAPAFTHLAASRAHAPALSQDGSRVAFADTADPLGANADGNSEIFFHDGARLRQLTDTAPGDVSTRVRDGNFQPSLSDDGELIAFTSNRDLTGANADGNLEVFLYSVPAGRFTQVTDTSGIAGASDAKLSGDGRRLAFINDDGVTAGQTSATRDLVLHDLTTRSTRVLAARINGLAFTPGRAISDDGSRVVYAASTAHNSTQVFLYDGRNDLVRQLTALGSRASDVPLNPTISGDGSRVAFATRRSVIGGNSDAGVELYLYDIPTGAITRVTDAPAAATAQVVSSLNDDGSMIVFNFPRVISGAVSAEEFANNSEIYAALLPPRVPFAANLRVQHGASFGKEPSTTKAVAPEQIAVATGTNLSLLTRQAQRLPDGRFPLTLAGVSLTVNGRPAQLLYVSPTHINFVVPAEAGPGAAEVVVVNHDGYESRGVVEIINTVPGLFTEQGDGAGEVIALEAANLLRSPFDQFEPFSNPRRLILFATGVRRAREVNVTAAGRPVTVEAIMPSPDLSGLDQIHVLLPHALRGAGLVPLVLRADGRESNHVSIRLGGKRRPASISLVPAAASLGAGRSLQLVALVLDEGGEPIADAPVVFSSSDETIVTIDAGGVARGLRAGAVTVRATTADLVATARLQVYTLGLVINEILADPPEGAAGDANRDGVRSSTQDEFVEIVNASDGDIDLGRYVLTTRGSNGNETVRHTFAPGAILAPGAAAVVFGGAQAATFNPNDSAFASALVFTASSGGLSLANGGSTVTLRDPTSALVEEITYGGATGLEGDRDQSLTRAPEVTGDFVPHKSATGAGGRAYSPGARADGTPFLNSRPLARVEVTPAHASLLPGERQQFTARAFDAEGREVGGVLFRWLSGNTQVATIDRSGLATALAAGTAEITAEARGTRSAPVRLEVRVPEPPRLTRIEVSPTSSTIDIGQTKQLTARAYDQNGREMTGLAFAWSSSSTHVATISQTGLATGVGAGSTRITASAAGVESPPALLQVTAPPVPRAGEVIINEALISFATSATQTRRDFLELYNTTDRTLDVSGLVISYRPPGAGNTPASVTLPGAVGSSTTLVAPRGYFLVVNGADTFGVAADFNASSFNFDLNNTTGGIKLEIGGVKLDGLTYQGGSAQPTAPFNAYGEGALFVFTGGTTNDLLRSPNATDTDNNAADFKRNGSASSVTPKAANPSLP